MYWLVTVSENTWSHQPMDNLEISQQITYRRYVQQGTAEGMCYYEGDTTCDWWWLIREHQTYVECPPPLHIPALWMTENTPHILRCSLLSHHCTLDDLLKFNDIGNECSEKYKMKSFDDTMMIMTSIRPVMSGTNLSIKHSLEPSDQPHPPPPTEESFLRLCLVQSN